ncbi:MAG: diacylglycerol kinase family protein [Planctomycetota bacterium]
MTGPVPFRRVAILTNRRSGSAGAAGDAVAMCEAWARRAGSLVLRGAERGGIGQQLDALPGTEPDLVIAIGGDGTINAGASFCVEHDVPLAIVPTGTMNLVAKDLDIPLDPLSAAACIERALVRRIDVGRAGGQVFLHSALVGLAPHLAKEREAMRSAETPLDALGAGLGWVRRLAAHEGIELLLRSDNAAARTTVHSLAVTVNPLRDDNVFGHRRSSLDSGVLGVYASGDAGDLAGLRTVATLASGRLESDPNTLRTARRSLTLESPSPSLDVALDGEVRTLRTPIEFNIEPCALRVLGGAA